MGEAFVCYAPLQATVILLGSSAPTTLTRLEYKMRIERRALHATTSALLLELLTLEDKALLIG